MAQSIFKPKNLVLIYHHVLHKGFKIQKLGAKVPSFSKYKNLVFRTLGTKFFKTLNLVLKNHQIWHQVLEFEKLGAKLSDTQAPSFLVWKNLVLG